MISAQKKAKLVLQDKSKPKVNFEPGINLLNKNLNFKEPLRTSLLDVDGKKKRRSTFHYCVEEREQKNKRKSYKFSSTVKKTKKTTRFKNLWISKRGTRNFYIMQNQDFVLIDEKNKDYRLYAILDGHGKYGKLIAQTAANKLSSKYCLDQKNIHKENPEFNNEKIMREAIQETNKYLNQSLSKEVSNSGCTLLTILIRDDTIYCFNIGSSRAILVVKGQDDTLLALPLSSDHNLKRFDERHRILQTKAVLEELKDQNGNRVGPQRIWKEGQKYPGIYITRSLGMRLSDQVGITSEPEVTSLKIRKNFQFILACSDGFWQVFSNDDAVDYLLRYWRQQNLQDGIDNLLDEAVRKWDKKSELMDDISIAVIRI